MRPVLSACLVFVAACSLPAQETTESPTITDGGLSYIDTHFENGSPLHWTIDQDHTINLFLVYDQERDSVNRASEHWHFRVEGDRGAELTFVLNNFHEIYNGRLGSSVSEKTIIVTSHDGKVWRPMATEFLEGKRLRFTVTLDSGSLYIASVEPYRLSDLDRLLKSIAENPLVDIQHIGHTVEGRPLEIVRVGHDDAPHRILIRARAHPWEPGGNWVVQGLIRRLLRNDQDAKRFLSQYAVDVMPMANKDGVVRGVTRFNMRGIDLNRNWENPADPQLAPENHALEKWLESMLGSGQRFDFAIELHNDAYGQIHVPHPPGTSSQNVVMMKRYESLLREHTWFTEGSRTSSSASTLAGGLYVRYGIFGCVQELNAHWIAGLNDFPSGRRWEEFGEGLCEVFYEYVSSGSNR